MASWNWNPANDPRRLDCLKALDALWSCYTPNYQLGHLYKFGETNSCTKQFKDLTTCMKMKLSKHSEAIDFLNKQYPDRSVQGLEQKRQNHVWKFREEPPEQFTKASGSKEETTN